MKDDLRRNQIAIAMREHKLRLFQFHERELANRRLVLEVSLRVRRLFSSSHKRFRMS